MKAKISTSETRKSDKLPIQDINDSQNMSKPFWRVTPLSIFLVTSIIIFCGGVSAFVIQYTSTHTVASKKSTNINSDSNTNCLINASGCPISNNPVSSMLPNQSSNPEGNTTVTSSNSMGTTCTQTILQYSTTQENNPSLPAGTSFISQYGEIGMKYACPGKNPIITPPTTEIVEIGSGPGLPTSTTAPTTTTSTNNISSGLTESQAAQQCYDNMANGAGGNAPQDYYILCMHRYGY